MLPARSFTGPIRVGREISQTLRAPWLSTVTYRSRAVTPMSEDDLRRLLESAQARNRAEGITGLVVYDYGYFFQWLEGPAEGLARVWDSVRHDPRHTDIELLNNQPTQKRFFGDWDLKLSTRSDGASVAGTPLGAFDFPKELIDSLYLRPEAASLLLNALATTPISQALPAVIDSSPSIASDLSKVLAASRSKPILLSLVKAVVIPQLVVRHPSVARALPTIDPHADELAHLLIAGDPNAASELVNELFARAGSIAPMCASLFEPAARILGDLWYDDDCSEFDVTLGLGRLQTAVHRLSLGLIRVAAAEPQVVLVAPQPGEIHMLGAALDAEMLWQGGWDTHSEFPATDASLQAMLAGTWFDALDLSLSAAFRREDWLPRMAKTIVQARNASLNPELVVVVGGRAFVEQGDAGLKVGADASNATSTQVVALTLQALRKQR